MVLYTCAICEFSSKLKTDYNRHLNTKKHKLKHENCDQEKKKLVFSLTNPQKSSEILTNYVKLPQKSSEILKNPHKLCENDKKKFSCPFCLKEFSREDNLNRHKKSYCKVRKENEESYKLQLDEKNKEVDEYKKEKEKLYDYIDKLIEKTGPTINIENQTNTQINLNDFGEEDISHISDKVKMKMLTLPYGMVQQMIEKVHFNSKKPENKNIALTNKRDKMMKVFRRKKWKYQDRNYTLEEIIRKNYNRLDEYYEETAKAQMLDRHIRRYEIFQKKFDMQDKELINRIKRETEMILLSENL